MAAEVGVAYVRVLPSMRGFSGKVRQGMGGVGGAGQDAGKRAGRGFVGGLGGSLKSVGGVLAGVFAAQQVTKFIGDTISAASDLGESVNAVQVTFGKAADGILKLGKNAATAVGLSQTEFQGMAVQFSAFATSIAGEGGNVVSVIDQISTRASDFASVMNLEVAEAAQLFQSGLAGETEPLRRFGIDLSAASVEAFAYANGIAASGEELSESQKVQARYQSLLEQTAKTQGDFANTSGELANQQRIMNAEWENAKAELGQALLPVATQVVSKFRDFIPSIVKFGKAFSDTLGPAIKTIASLFGGFFSSMSTSQSALSGVRDSFGSIGGTIQQLLPPIQSLGREFLALVGPSLQRIGAIITGSLIPAFASFFSAVRPVLEFVIKLVGGALIGAFTGAITFIEGALEIIAGVLQVFAGIFTGDWEKVWDGVKKIASGVWKAIKGAFQFFLNVGILRIARVGLSLLRGLFSAAWGAIKSAARSAWSNLTSTIRGAWGRIKSAVRGGISAVLRFIRSLPGRIKGALGNLGSLLYNAGKSILDGLIDGLWSMVGKVTAPVSAAVDKVKSYWPFSPAETGPLRRDPPETWGVNVMAGVAAGLREGARTLGPSSSLAASNVSPGLPMSGVPSTAARAAGATIVLSANGDRHLLAWLREMVRQQGGNVQVVLGA